jgi:riboflavin synthase
MFTGLVEEKGRVKAFRHLKNLSTLTISCSKVARGTKIGDSVAVCGVCLTVIRKTASSLIFEMMKETLQSTTLKSLKLKDAVNLERALKMNDRLGGHFVTGHVDGAGKIRTIKRLKNYLEFSIEIRQNLEKYFVPKGSVCVDGVSLTVGQVKGRMFSFYLIPHTVKTTTFSDRRVGDRVNVETDILAKYLFSRQK